MNIISQSLGKWKGGGVDFAIFFEEKLISYIGYFVLFPSTQGSVFVVTSFYPVKNTGFPCFPSKRRDGRQAPNALASTTSLITPV
jgi:hypothetical protein